MVVDSTYLLLLVEHEVGEQLALHLTVDRQKWQWQAGRLAQVALVRGQVDLKLLAFGHLGIKVEPLCLCLNLRTQLLRVQLNRAERLGRAHVVARIRPLGVEQLAVVLLHLG